ncbi:hypothetical protein C9J03_02490 [Photobacterium gaetbulicola]|uniref:Uncharacterized protein n=1 Tax=Photobacterium gaetbulicola Gung47 TaxID=658445 RepID=A0A0C5WSZ0_9GAMM|nr:hypothetical protein [Photobacterium gaetbulicola]AJR09517.1 hypothetical protein H744_2c2864 [Photobacterium gaetbulicola Gung47]PSU14312.1 hypothetical protein C9J03_02490 [Photobacterium gaetbulicola]
MLLFNKFKIAVARTTAFFSVLYSLYSFFRKDASVEVNKLSFYIFASKYINMIVMFIPIKLLFILSGAKNISFLFDIEQKLGRNTYIALLVCIVIVLYIFDMVAKIYKGKLTNQQKDKIENKKYSFRGKDISQKIVQRTYSPYCQMISDFLVLAASIFVFLVLSPHYAVYYVCVVVSYFLLLEYLLFSPHQTRLLKKLNLDNNQFIQVCNGILYLIFFLGIVAVLFVKSIHILVAILILLVARISTTSLRTVFTSQKALRRDFFVNHE